MKEVETIVSGGQEILQNGLSSQRDKKNYQSTVLTHQEHLEQINFERVLDEAEGFVRGIDFTESILVISQVIAPEGFYYYEFTDFEWDSSGHLLVNTTYTGSDGGPAAEFQRNLFIAIRADPPRTATVTIENDPYRDGKTTTIQARVLD